MKKNDFIELATGIYRSVGQEVSQELDIHIPPLLINFDKTDGAMLAYNRLYTITGPDDIVKRVGSKEIVVNVKKVFEHMEDRFGKKYGYKNDIRDLYLYVELLSSFYHEFYHIYLFLIDDAYKNKTIEEINFDDIEIERLCIEYSHEKCSNILKDEIARAISEISYYACLIFITEPGSIEEKEYGESIRSEFEKIDSLYNNKKKGGLSNER